MIVRGGYLDHVRADHVQVGEAAQDELQFSGGEPARLGVPIPGATRDEVDSSIIFCTLVL